MAGANKGRERESGRKGSLEVGNRKLLSEGEEMKRFTFGFVERDKLKGRQGNVSSKYLYLHPKQPTPEESLCTRHLPKGCRLTSERREYYLLLLPKSLGFGAVFFSFFFNKHSLN